MIRIITDNWVLPTSGVDGASVLVKNKIIVTRIHKVTKNWYKKKFGNIPQMKEMLTAIENLKREEEAAPLEIKHPSYNEEGASGYLQKKSDLAVPEI